MEKRVAYYYKCQWVTSRAGFTCGNRALPWQHYCHLHLDKGLAESKPMDEDMDKQINPAEKSSWLATLKPGQVLRIGEDVEIQWTGKQGIGRRVQIRITKPKDMRVMPVKGDLTST